MMSNEVYCPEKEDVSGSISFEMIILLTQVDNHIT